VEQVEVAPRAFPDRVTGLDSRPGRVILVFGGESTCYARLALMPPPDRIDDGSGSKVIRWLARTIMRLSRSRITMACSNDSSASGVRRGRGWKLASAAFS